jgi:serine/threonine protein kinase
VFALKQIACPPDFDKKRLDEVTLGWKNALKKTENIVLYYEHWYEEKKGKKKNDEYAYVVMEYCAGGDLAEKIKKTNEEKRKFTEKVLYYALI